MAPTSILFFGDQTVDAGAFLKTLVQISKTSPALSRFFADALSSLKLEISNLPSHEKNILPLEAFHSAHDLVGYDGEGGIVLSTVLQCLAQLGDYILRAERDATLLGASGANPSQRVVVGFCTGLLPAAATAMGGADLSDFTSIACHITLVSLRLALYARHRSSLVEMTSPADKWALAVVGVSQAECQSAINRFHRTNTISSHKQVYISSESVSNVTVSGPPSVLKDFESYCASSGFRCGKLPIFAAFHSPHLPAPNVDSIIGSSPLLSTPVPEGTKLIDPSTGVPYVGDTLSDLLRNAVGHILQQKLYPQRAVDSALEVFPPSPDLTVSIFGPPSAQNLWRQALKAGGPDESANVHISDIGQRSTPVPEHISGAGGLGPDAIAIVGMSGRFPGGNDLAQFWDTLIQSKDMHKAVPKDRWDTELHVDPTGQKPNTTRSGYGCFLDQPGAFDNLLFNMSPRESMQTDPMQRLLLHVTYEALEMAGYRYDIKQDLGRVGTFVGIATGDWGEYNSCQDIDMYYVTGGLRSFNSGRLNYFFKFDGPSLVVDTACASSGAAIELGVASLLNGKTDMAIAGGANTMTGPNLSIGLGRGGFTSQTGGCKTFDETADGYCRGEGVGVVVMKRLNDAVAAGDEILGVIRGISTNHSAYAASITQPHSPTQVSLFKEVLHQSGLAPHQIGYVEMHGTGTQAGDVVEMTSVMSVFGSDRKRASPLFVGGVKSNVGHSEGAAGVTGVIKALMMLRENAIPPHAGIKTRINPKLPPFEDANIRIPLRVEPFLAGPEPRRVLISTFGATGGNTCLIVEEAPIKETPKQSDPRSHHIIAVSAKSQASLQGNKQRLLDFLDANPGLRIEDVAYTSTARRAHHSLRCAFTVATIRELKALLDPPSGPIPGTVVASKSQPSVIFVFPGQGFNFFGLAKTLYQTSETFSRTLDELQDLAKFMGFPQFLDDILDDGGRDLDDFSSLSPVQAHLSIVAIEIALALLLKSWGITPDAVVGHSLGEYAALCAAGVLTVSDTILLVGQRARLVEDLCAKSTHGMLVIQASADQFRRLVSADGQDVPAHEIACFNSPSSIVVNGHMSNLEKIEANLRDSAPGVKASYISVPYSFHSAQLDPVLEEFLEAAGVATFSKPIVPVYSTLLGKKVDTEGVFSASYLAQQSRKAVQFVGAIDAIKADGLVSDKSLFFEVGPGAMCTSMVRATLVGNSCKFMPCLKSAETSCRTLSTVTAEAYTSGVSVDWTEYHRQYKPHLSLIELPSYNFSLKDFWIQYKGGTAAAERTIAGLRQEIDQLAAEQRDQPAERTIPQISTYLHRVIEENIREGGGASTVAFSTDLQDPQVRQLINGHKVIGVALAPSSLYKAMALGAAHYLWNRLRPDGPVSAMDLHDLIISSPLLLNQGPDAAPQLITIRATASLGSAQPVVDVRVSSPNKEHCRCMVSLQTGHWAKDLTRRASRLRDRARGLMAANGKGVHRLLQDMVYRIFTPITDYSKEYRCISDAFIEKSFREAVMRVELEETEGNKEPRFAFDSCCLDIIAQTAGFMLNSDVANSEDVMYMSTGCDTLRLTEELRGGRQYLCHVRAETAIGTAGEVECDVSVLLEKPGGEVQVVALGEGLRFKQIKRSLLGKMLALSGQSPPAVVGGPTPRITDQTAPHSGNSGYSAAPPISKVPPPVVARDTHRPIPETAMAKSQQTPVSNLQPRPGISAAPPIPGPAPLITAVLDIISDETGTSLGQIQDGMSLEDLGVDSLLSISIASRLKSERDLELPAALLSGATTIADLGQYFVDNSADGVHSDADGESSSSSYSSMTDEEAPMADSSATTQRSLESEDQKVYAWDTNATGPQTPAPSNGPSHAPDGTRSGAPKPGNSALVEAILDTLSKETGIARSEIGEETPFSDLGVDSLMSVAIITTVAEQTGEQLPANVFTDCCISELQTMYGGIEERQSADDPPPHHASNNLPSPGPPAKTFDPASYHSRPVLLQGRPRSGGPTLFLVADGGGSASVYIHLPTLSPNLTVYGLDSPMINGRENDFFLPGLTATDFAPVYARAIRSIQADGPYLIGGYSIGGVFAYETMRYLIDTGSSIHSFLIIDSACPWGLKGIFDVDVDMCQRFGMFDSISQEDIRKPLTENQKLHVAGCTLVGNRVQPVPIAPEKQPRHVFCIWARVGLMTHIADRLVSVGHAIARERGMELRLEPEWIERLQAEKASFGPRGWDKLIGSHAEISVIEGDHFSIMMRPRIKKELGPLLQRLVVKILEDYPKPATPTS